MNEPINSANQEITVVAKIKLHNVLADRRIGRHGLIFGTVEKVAKQYGIKCLQDGRYVKFTAPKSRLQMFVEKLHFAGVPFMEV